MFYATKIKTVGNGGAIDVQGKFLTFIGYLPVKAGDTVYTDGKVIFGNAPPKGAPAIFDVQSGIPVLASDLRGYVTPQGKFKTYRIAGSKWTTNDKKNYKHDTDSADIIDAEIATDGGLLTAEKKITRIAADDYDYHWGFYQKETNSIFAPINFGRIAVHVPGDDFYDKVRGFQMQRQYDGTVRFFYQNIGGNVTSSYNDGFYWAFEQESTGLGINMATCYFFLKSRSLDYSMADNNIIRSCEFIINKDAKEYQRINVADLLKTFEDAAKSDVDLFPDRESVKHVKSRAIIHNFKILPDGNWETLIEAEIWASNTFYNETEERDQNTGTIITTPFHISSTVSHSHLLLKFKSNNTCDKIWAWKFIYPLKFRDSYIGEGEDSVSVDGAWIIRTVASDTSDYAEIWRDYDSRRETNPLEYDKPITESTDKFYFSVQDDFYALINFAGIDDRYIGKRTFPESNIGEFFWNFGGVVDSDNQQVVANILPDDNDAHKWNMSLAKLKSGGYLFGIHDGALYKITDSSFELVGNGLKNFRLRELKNISKAKR